jgi:NADH-quinone oxidoreductase subunit M
MSEEPYSLLNCAILTPLAFAVALCFVRAASTQAIRWLAIFGALLTGVLSVMIFDRYNPQDVGFQLAHKVAWVKPLDLNWHVGVDGISATMILLAGIVGFTATLVSWDVQRRQKEFYILLLVMIGGTIGMFASLDIFFLYAFHELALIPTFLMIGIWGSGQREYAAMKMTLYLSAGAFVALLGLIALYLAPPPAQRTFDVVKLLALAQSQPFGGALQNAVYPLLLFGLGTLVSLVPFHTWAPIGYGSAPTATAMLHAGVIKKFGLYALIRIALPLLPSGAQDWNWMLLVLLLANIVYCGLVAMTQRNFNYLLGYSSVAHMGFAFLGIAALSYTGLTGAVIVMFAHGLLAALVFGLSGYLYAQTGTREISELGGLCKPLPFIGTALVMAGMASIGLPGFANFAGELIVLFGAWHMPEWMLKIGPVRLSWPVMIAVWGGAVIGAVYMLRAIRDICFGELPARWQRLVDANFAAKVPYLILLGMLIWAGVYPRMLVDTVKPSAVAVVEAMEKSRAKDVTPLKPTR